MVGGNGWKQAHYREVCQYQRWYSCWSSGSLPEGRRQRAVQHDGRPVLCLRLPHHRSSQQGPHLALYPAVQDATQVPRQLWKLAAPPSPLLSAGSPSGLIPCSTGCHTSATATLETVQAEATPSGRCRSTSLTDVTTPTLTRTSPVVISCPLAATSTTKTSSGSC